MATFQAKIFVTSNADLLRYAKTKKAYLKLIDDGNNIITLDDLLKFKLPKTKSKLAIILHIPSEQQTSIGHWCIMLISLENKQLLFIDPLNLVLNKTKINDNVQMFCLKHNLYFKTWNVKIQRNSSNCCALIILYFLHLFSCHSLHAINQLKKVYGNYSLQTREAVILKKVLKQFNV